MREYAPNVGNRLLLQRIFRQKLKGAKNLEKMKCRRCGKDRYVIDGMCAQCHQASGQETIKQDFDDFYAEAEKNEEFYAGSDEFVICPHCGYAMPTDYCYEDFPEIYEEGEHEIECPECRKYFELETTVSYYYETQKLKD